MTLVTQPALLCLTLSLSLFAINTVHSSSAVKRLSRPRVCCTRWRSAVLIPGSGCICIYFFALISANVTPQTLTKESRSCNCTALSDCKGGHANICRSYFKRGWRSSSAHITSIARRSVSGVSCQLTTRRCARV